jgi:signal transduction histidine kinase
MLASEMTSSNTQPAVIAVNGIGVVPTILDVVCRITGMGFAAVARVTEDRWIACGVRDEIAFGLRPGGELKVETTICDEIRQSREAVVIDNVSESETYCRHPTPAIYGFQSYISMPIVLPDGTFFGTLCAIDPRPARLNTPEIVGMFRLFAELIAFHLDALERVASSEVSLLNERQASELREQFIAVLGHDLRNPLSAIGASAELLQKMPLNGKASRLTALIRQSVSRISVLVDDVLDFARGRLGGGLVLNSKADEPLTPVLVQIIAELRAAWPDRVIEEQFSVAEPVTCDGGRIGQLLSNLLGNALKHGAPGSPVRVCAATDPASFTLSVANLGDPIPPAALEHLFQPFFRGAIQPTQQGLGLGLYIASEVARAHGGTLDVASSADETCFTFRMPLA